MSVATTSSNSEQKEVTMKRNPDVKYKKRTGAAGAHGQFMEINLLTLFKLQADKRIKEFYLAGNYNRAGDFDDIVMRYADANDWQNVIFLQAYSKKDNNSKVGLKIFETGEKFDLQKHFKAFLTIQDEFKKSPDACPIFSGNPENLNCHYVMYTNAIRDDSMIEHVEEVERHPLSVILGEKSGQAFKLKAEAATKIFRATQTTDEIETIIKLIKALSNTDCKNLQRDENFQIYHAFLTQTILVKNESIWKFRNEFLEGATKDETLTKLREMILCWFADNKMDKSTNKKTRNDDIKKFVKSWKFNLPDWFGIEIDFNAQVCDKLLKIATQCICDNVCIITKLDKKLINKVSKFAGNVFVFDEKTEMFKFNDETLDGEPRKVLEYLAANLNICNNTSQIQFDFRVDKFPRLSLGFIKIDPRIAGFIKTLTIMTSQPGGEHLDKLIKHNFGNVSDGEVTRRYLLAKEKIKKWWEQSDDTPYLRKDDNFFDGILCGIHFGMKDPLQSFIGRDAELKKLHKALQQNKRSNKTAVILQTVSVSGLGGIGKTSLARKYANEHSNDYDGNVIWIDAETHQSMSGSFRMLCTDYLKMTTQNANNEEMQILSIVQQVYSYFRDRKCLFIFDNAQYFKNDKTNNDGIKNFLPAEQNAFTNLHFLITSRNQNWSTAIRLGVFKNKEAVELVKSSLGLNDDKQDNEVNELIRALHNFPLGIQQAIAYINQTAKKYIHFGKQFKVSDYLKQFADKTKQLLDFKFPCDSNDEYTRTTFSTWNITLSEIEKTDLGKEAREIINIMAYLNPDDIPVAFFAKIVNYSDDKLIQVLTMIEEYSMITLHEGKANIHRLVQSVTRITLQEANIQNSVLEKAIGLIEYHTDSNLIIQGASIWNYVAKNDEMVNEFYSFAGKVLDALHDTIRFEEATLFGNSTLCSLKRVLGPDHPVSLRTQKSIAQILSKQAKYKDALGSYTEVLQEEVRILGPDHPDILATELSIAQISCSHGKYEYALGSYREVLEKQLKILGPDHPDTLTTEYSIAEILFNQGKYEDALGSYKEVLEKQLKTLGPDHPDTLTTEYSIAQILFNQCKYEDALGSYKEMLEKQLKILGPDHPDTLITQSSIAHTLSKQSEQFWQFWKQRKLNFHV